MALPINTGKAQIGVFGWHMMRRVLAQQHDIGTAAFIVYFNRVRPIGRLLSFKEMI
jgi:hypothetical protein